MNCHDIKPISLASVMLVMCSLSIATHANTSIYVDDDAPLGGDGRSWDTAYPFLQDAMVKAKGLSSETSVEIRVAQGIYNPDRSSEHPEGTGDREASFELDPGMTLKGGFAGLNGTDPNAWSVEHFVTTLSGDLAGDDIPVEDPCDLYDEPTRWDNSSHVVIADRSTIIDGFLVTGGRAIRIGAEGGDVGPLPWNSGGGIYVIGDGVSMHNCLIQGNLAIHGGGGVHVSYDLTGITLSNCRLVGNANHGYGFGGGGLYAAFDQIIITDCEFVGNWAGIDGGGALLTGSSDVVLSSVVFRDNKSHRDGGALATDLGSIIVSDSIFKNNESKGAGGAINNEAGGSWDAEGRIELIRSVFIGNWSSCGGAIMNYGRLLSEQSLYCGNTARSIGGVFYSSTPSLTVTNCTFAHNRAPVGAFLAASETYRPLAIRNCIIVNGEDYDIFNDQANVGIEYTAMADNSSLYGQSKDVIEGLGNIFVNPCLVDPGYWDSNGTSDDTNDDFFVAGDYHLKSQAGHWDSNSESWVYDDVISPCIDAGDPNSPIGNEPFPNGGRVNMGAYGGTAEASKSYFGEPICDTIMAGDINGDCRVDSIDLKILMEHWLEDRSKPGPER